MNNFYALAEFLELIYSETRSIVRDDLFHKSKFLKVLVQCFDDQVSSFSIQRIIHQISREEINCDKSNLSIELDEVCTQDLYWPRGLDLLLRYPWLLPGMHLALVYWLMSSMMSSCILGQHTVQ